MSGLIIKNGLVFDPINNIDGEIKDILIESGKIIEKFSSETDVREINAKGKTVIPSAIDIHTHVASQQVNWVRLLGVNNHKFKETWNRLTLKNIAKNYILNGYTFILEANVFPSLTKQTIFNFKQLPVLDKAMLLNISNFWPLEIEFQRRKIEEMAYFLSDLLSKTFGFGVKVYNPFENENWNLKDLREDISQIGRLYNFSALDIYENVVKSVESLGLPHSTHVHIEGYENEIGKRNLMKVLEKIKAANIEAVKLSNSNLKREQILHIAHANSYNYDGDNQDFINFLNENQNFDIDVSFLGFNKINPVITSDRRLIQSILKEDINDNPYKLITSAVEFEGDSFVFFRVLEKSNYDACVLWANALDLALNINNKFQVSFSLNFPNYANISDIPDIATWLVSKKARENFMKDMNNDFLNKNSLSTNDTELNFSEFVCLTRVSPAKSLGLANIKGNLGLGADGDLNILDINVKEIDISNKFEEIKNALSNIDYVIKAGTIIKKQNEIFMDTSGSIFYSTGSSKIKEKDFLMSKKKNFYQKYSSVFYNSYKNSIDKNLLRKID